MCTRGIIILLAVAGGAGRIGFLLLLPELLSKPLRDGAETETLDRFLTNNRRNFPRSTAEVDVTYPDDLPD